MPTFVHGSAARLIGNGVNLGAIADSFQAEGTLATSPATPLDTSDAIGPGERFTMGIASASYKASGFSATESVAAYADGSNDMIARAFKGSGVVIAAPLGDAIGKPAIPLVAGVTRASQPLVIGETVGWNIDGTAQQGFEPGVVLLPWSTQTGAFTGGVLDSGASSALGAVAHISIGRFVGTSASLKVQHATSSGGTYADAGTFTTIVAGRGGERITIPAGTLNQFLRVLATGTFTVLELIVSISRK